MTTRLKPLPVEQSLCTTMLTLSHSMVETSSLTYERLLHIKQHCDEKNHVLVQVSLVLSFCQRAFTRPGIGQIKTEQ